MRVLLLPLLLTAIPAQVVDPLGRSILFVRGADGSGGATEGGTFAQRTEQLGDITNGSTAGGNHGYLSLATALRSDGFTVSQRIETSTGTLRLSDLLPHRVVVFGSNNKVYTAAEVAAFHSYMDAGGSALFISDANWGLTWEAAPASDNQFLARYGCQVYQDSGMLPTMARSTTGRYLIADHPVLSGFDGLPAADNVDQYNGEGVNLFRITAGSGGYQARAMVSASGLQVRLNNPAGGPGATQPAGSSDAAMVVCQKGLSRLVGHFDRNTFFNRNGAGTDLFKLDNQQLALNIFRYLAAARPEVRDLGAGCGVAQDLLLQAGAPVLARSTTLDLSGAPAQATGWLLFAPGAAAPFTWAGCTVHLDPLKTWVPLVFATDAQGAARIQATLPAAHPLGGLQVSAQAVVFVTAGPFLGGGRLSNGLQLRLGSLD